MAMAEGNHRGNNQYLVAMVSNQVSNQVTATLLNRTVLQTNLEGCCYSCMSAHEGDR